MMSACDIMNTCIRPMPTFFCNFDSLMIAISPLFDSVIEMTFTWKSNMNLEIVQNIRSNFISQASCHYKADWSRSRLGENDKSIQNWKHLKNYVTEEKSCRRVNLLVTSRSQLNLGVWVIAIDMNNIVMTIKLGPYVSNIIFLTKDSSCENECSNFLGML